MKLASFHLITSILIFQWRYILCSHFRGGIITWKPEGNQIEITYRVAFRRNYSTSHTCFDVNINNRIILQGEGNLECFGGCSGIIVSPMSYYCTDYSLGENWSAGSRVTNYTFTSTNFQIGYDSCCWISTLNVGKDSKWRLFASANLQMRQDVGRINTSPVSGMAPIVRMKLGCTYALRIPVEDDDGDIVKCRWANDTNSYAECYGVSHAVPGATIDEDSCILHWTPTGSLGWYAVAVQIEDYASSSATTPFSSVPLQFLLDVSALTGSCDDKPSIIPPSGNVSVTDETKPEVYLHKNDTYVDIIIANTGSTSISITEIITVSPVGMIKSPVTPYGDSGMEWYVNITWTPAPGQGGSHIFCYTAVNSLGQTSDQHCITIKVDEVDECLSNPCSNGGTCINDINRYRCTCPSSHTGIHCETDIDFCDGVTCLNGGTCMDGVFDYSCSCPASHTGVHCQTEIDFCVGVQCQNGGSCVDGLFDYACSCPTSHTGKNCEIDIDFCNGHACLNGGTCVDGAFDYTCVCPGSHSGYHCEKDIDFCVGVACQNGGSCVDGLFDYSCECLLSQTGKHCEDDIDFCNGITCLNGGTCIDGVFNYSCLCPASHTGGQCQTDIDLCVGVDCKNGGTCMDGLFDYSCSCPTSHTGKHCETDIDFCAGIVCQHEGVCVDGLFDYSCTCPMSHAGKNCETDIDFCEGITCRNGGTCVDGLFNYSCVCPASHTGGHCQTDVDFCQGATCYNGGTCVDGVFDYNCMCPRSHTGDHCQTDVDFCQGVFCKNGGTCVDGLMTFHCSCPTTHVGTYCEQGTDNKGKEFILGYIPNANTNDPILEIHITTEYLDVKVQISTPLYSNITHSITVTKGEVYKHVFEKDLQGISGSVENKGIYVKADADIVVHAINREDYSSDVFLVLPSDVLGLNHYIISYNDRSAFIVVGTENETDVSITISSTASGVVYNGNIYTSGQMLAVKLQAYQTLVIAAVDGDLTGSNVTGTKPLAVISGSICAKIGSGSCDHLVQQIPPVTRWGTDFVTFSMPECSNSNSFRVVSSVANTVVSVQGFSTYTMSQPGSYKSFVIPNSESRTISASNPVAVAMFVNGNCNGTGTGDPTMILIPPISQFSNNFTFSTVDASSNDFENYVTIAIIDDFVPGLRLDNNALEVTKWKSVNGRNDMKITHLKIERGAHSLRNIIETVTFMTIVTGTQSFNSYGYPAGVLFDKYTPNCSESIPNLESGVTEDSCYRDLDPCQDVQCFNNGSCHPSGWIEFICKCAEGYIGKLCQIDIDYCVNVTCLNGGVCVDGLLSYTCNCPISHTGKNCETDVNFCEAVKCENNGTCIDDVFGYSCTCPASHTGKLCEIDINYCNTSIAKRDILCENGGTCLDGLLDYSCLCPDTHSGDLCEDEISTAGYIVSVVIISGGLVLSGGVLTYAVYNVLTTASKAQNMVGYFPFD